MLGAEKRRLLWLKVIEDTAMKESHFKTICLFSGRFSRWGEHMRTNRHFSKGLTLIELMVTIAILVLSILLAAPSFSEYLNNRKIRNVAESLSYGMVKAESEAVTSTRQTEFAWSGQQWTASRLNTTEPPTTPPTWVRDTTIETFDWGGGTHDWSVVEVYAYLPGSTAAPVGSRLGGGAGASATVTFEGGSGHVISPNTMDPAIASPMGFCVSIPTRPSSRPLWVTVGGGGRVCDPQLTGVGGGKECRPALPSTCP
jgi:type IV fimbrial biogenesis protein FimT